jgi:hypothetical protein
MAHRAARADPAEGSPAAVPVLGWGLGGALAVSAWIGWLTLAPELGFPKVAPAAMFTQVLDPGADGGSALGWAVLLAGLGLLACAYFVAIAKRVIRPSLSSGAVYGLALWLITGAILMPIMGLMSSASAEPASVMGRMPMPSGEDPMRMTVMMIHLGPLAPFGALIAWSFFGLVLGATARRLHGDAH